MRASTYKGKIVFICVFTAFSAAFYLLSYVHSELRWLKYHIEEIHMHDVPQDKRYSSDVLFVPSDYCLSEIKAKINHQRKGWGSLSPSDLFRGAKETFELSLREAIPIEAPRRILDIGCGFALYDTFLLKHYGYPPDMHLYLFDKTTDLEKEKDEGFKVGGFRREGISFYTNLQCASDILISNGASKNNIHTLVVTENALSQLNPSSFDLVFSLLSYGHHYPVSTYMKEIKRILVQGGVLILDLRLKDGVTQGLSELEQNGFTCEIFRHRKRGKSVKCVLE